MHPKLMKFLNGPSRCEGKTILTYLSELIAVNGGSIDIKKIGSMKVTNPWGRTGLTPNEAFELTGMVQFAHGIMFTLELDLTATFNEAIQNEISKQVDGRKIYVPLTEEVQKFSQPFRRA